MVFSIILLIILITFNGFFAGSEIAFISLKERSLKTLRDEGDRKAELILKLKKIPNKFCQRLRLMSH